VLEVEDPARSHRLEDPNRDADDGPRPWLHRALLMDLRKWQQPMCAFCFIDQQRGQTPHFATSRTDDYRRSAFLYAPISAHQSHAADWQAQIEEQRLSHVVSSPFTGTEPALRSACWSIPGRAAARPSWAGLPNARLQIHARWWSAGPERRVRRLLRSL